MPRQGQELATSKVRAACLCPKNHYCHYSIPRPARFLARPGAALAVADGQDLAPSDVCQVAEESLPPADTLWMHGSYRPGFQSRFRFWYVREMRTFRNASLVSTAAIFCTALLVAPAQSEAACAERNIAASAVRTEADVEAFVHCAHELIEEVGVDAAYEIFHNDPRWKSGPTYIFGVELIPDGSKARALLFPPLPSREEWTTFDRTDRFGGDRQAAAVRVIEEYGGGWYYYTFTNPATGTPAPKASYILPVDWNGTPGYIGSGVYRRDFPGACEREEVNAAGLSAEPSNAKLREFVRCAALQVEANGYFATQMFRSDERWKSGSAYVFGLDLAGNHVFTGRGLAVNGVSLAEWTRGGLAEDPFVGRDVAGIGDAFGEIFLYYDTINPATGSMGRKVSIVQRVTAYGIPILVGAGYFVD